MRMLGIARKLARCSIGCAAPHQVASAEYLVQQNRVQTSVKLRDVTSASKATWRGAVLIKSSASKGTQESRDKTHAQWRCVFHASKAAHSGGERVHVSCAAQKQHVVQGAVS